MTSWGQYANHAEFREKIQALRRALRKKSSRVTARELKDRVDELEQENEELRLQVAALIQYLGAKGVIQPEGFVQLVTKLDALDGKVDGRMDVEEI